MQCARSCEPRRGRRAIGTNATEVTIASVGHSPPGRAIGSATKRCFCVPIAGERFAANALVSSAEVAEHCLVAYEQSLLNSAGSTEVMVGRRYAREEGASI
jgi:hypothetical protein